MVICMSSACGKNCCSHFGVECTPLYLAMCKLFFDQSRLLQDFKGVMFTRFICNVQEGTNFCDNKLYKRDLLPVMNLRRNCILLLYFVSMLPRWAMLHNTFINVVKVSTTSLIL